MYFIIFIIILILNLRITFKDLREEDFCGEPLLNSIADALGYKRINHFTTLITRGLRS